MTDERLDPLADAVLDAWEAVAQVDYGTTKGDAKARRRCVIHDNIAVAGDIICHLFDELDADIAAPGILHAAGRDQPKWIIGNPHRKVRRQRGLPQSIEIMPAR